MMTDIKLAYSRRGFLNRALKIAALPALTALPALVQRVGWAHSADLPDLLRETFNGLIAFVVPGPDGFSVAQGVSTPEPGGLEANILEVLLTTLNLSQPIVPPFPAFSGTVAAVLNGFAQAVNPTPAGPFVSPFANLSFAEKVTAFAYMEGNAAPEAEPVRVLAGLLPGLVSFLVYSEAGVFDPTTRTLTGIPLGWQLTGYDGRANGWPEFKGYLNNVQKAE